MKPTVALRIPNAKPLRQKKAVMAVSTPKAQLAESIGPGKIGPSLPEAFVPLDQQNTDMVRARMGARKKFLPRRAQEQEERENNAAATADEAIQDS